MTELITIIISLLMSFCTNFTATIPDTVESVTANLTTIELDYESLKPTFVITHERPKNNNEIYCPEGLTLEEWWRINPPNDGAYDDWDDENNSPDIIY